MENDRKANHVPTPSGSRAVSLLRSPSPDDMQAQRSGITLSNELRDEFRDQPVKLDLIRVDDLRMAVAEDVHTDASQYLPSRIYIGTQTIEIGPCEVWALLTSSLDRVYGALPNLHFRLYSKGGEVLQINAKDVVDDTEIDSMFKGISRDSLVALIKACFILKDTELPKGATITDRFIVDLRQALGRLSKPPTVDSSRLIQEVPVQQSQPTTNAQEESETPSSRPHRNAKAKSLMAGRYNLKQLSQRSISVSEDDEFETPRPRSFNAIIPKKRHVDFDDDDSVTGPFSDHIELVDGQITDEPLEARVHHQAEDEVSVWTATGKELRNVYEVNAARADEIEEAKLNRDVKYKAWQDGIEAELEREFQEQEEALSAQLRAIQDKKEERRQARREQIDEDVGKLSETVRDLEKAQNADKIREEELERQFQEHHLFKEQMKEQNKERTRQILKGL